MSPLIFLALALAGGLGAVCRFVLDAVIKTRVSDAMPWGTITINLTGSFLLGLVVGLTGGHVLPESVHLIAGTGFLGGYTTFSTASLETLRLLQERRVLPALANGVGVLAVAMLAAGAGMWLGGLI